jgi:beta-lactamase regulating signal transducer with metallopeptidase domain
MQMMDLIFQIVVNNVAMSLALALIAVSAGMILKRPVITHLLWLLVLVKLLTPPMVTISAVPIPWMTGTAAPAGFDTNTRTAQQDLNSIPFSEIPGNEFGSRGEGFPAALHWKQLLFLAWFLGSGIVLAWSLFQVHRFNRLMHKESEAGSPEIQASAASTASLLGLNTVPAIHTISANVSPMVWWIGGKVRIVIPAALIERMDPRQVRWILAHEMAHVHRRDYLVRWIEWLACVFFWWNPIAWWARYNLRASEELCCDTLVLSRLKLDPYNYGDSILKAVEILSFPAAHSFPITASGINGGKPLRRRFRMITSQKLNRPNSRWLQACTLLGALTVLPLGLMTTQTGCGGSAQKEETESAPLPVPYVQKDACPFEGCTYGIWDVLKDTDVYKEPDTNSQVSGLLKHGEKIRALTGEVHVIPGRAIATGQPPSSVRDLDPEKEIFILDYIGEGRSRVFQDGNFAEVKIARSKNQCMENPDLKYCWVEILEEPIVNWWVSIESLDGKIKGWALMEGDALKPMDALAFGQDPVRAVIDDPDGYTNVREKPTVQSGIIYQLKEGERFSCYPEQNSNWWRIVTGTNVSGYVHKSRIKES